MATLTPEQLLQIEFNNSLENTRHANEIAQKLLNAKVEAVRLAKETLTENRRNLPVSEREISAEEIIDYAETILTYIKS